MIQLYSDNINDLACSLCKAQGEMTSALHDKINPHFKSSYASLNSVWDACRVPLSKNGLSIVQQISTENDMFVLTTTLFHSSGQFLRSILPLVALKSSSQALGSSLTYMRRYSIASLVGITTDEDDDANQANDYQKKNPLVHNHNAMPSPPIHPITKEQKIDFVIPDGFNDFVKKHGLGIVNPDPLKYQYLIETSDKAKMTPEKVIAYAMKNEDVFLNRFNAWIESKNPKKVDESIENEPIFHMNKVEVDE